MADEFRPDNWAARLVWLRRPRHYVAVCWAFVFGSACHLWLADAAQPDWWVANAIYVVGLVLLVFRSYLIGWTLSAIGVAIPLFFLRDQLTQSTILLFTAAIGIATEVRCLWKPTRSGIFIARSLKTIGLIGAATYVIAALHKLNDEFLNPATSCAVYGFNKVELYYNLPVTTVSGVWDEWLPHFALLMELSIPFFYLIRRRRLAWIAAIVFHIPLTVTMAPAFAFVMAIGHVAMAKPADFDWAKHTLKTRGIVAVIVGLFLTAISVGMHLYFGAAPGIWPEWSMIPKEFLLWFALALLLLAPGQPAVEPNRIAPFRFVVALFVINGLTPYLGIQYQHTAAMLSNLRIDEGCWNSAIVPEAVRLTDDYVRVDGVYFRRPGANEKYEEIVLTQLWSPPQIRQMRRNWCRVESRPLYLSGTFRGERWTIEDLCADEMEWPFSHAGVFGVEIFGDFLRFQKNLERECPQACIH